MDRLNPYSSPNFTNSERPYENRIGKFGLCVSMFGIVTFVLLCLLYAMSVQLPKVLLPVIAISLMCSPLGVLVSSVSLIWAPRNLGVWGVVVGVIGSLYVPTLIIGMFR